MVDHIEALHKAREYLDSLKCPGTNRMLYINLERFLALGGTVEQWDAMADEDGNPVE